jgi:hypothetical protein
MRRSPCSWTNSHAKLGVTRGRKGRPRRSSRRLGRTSACEFLEARHLLAVFTWDGGGANANWTTADNWIGDVAPSAGDDLVFAGSTQTSTQNDFAAGTSFNSITLSSGDFTLAGY